MMNTKLKQILVSAFVVVFGVLLCVYGMGFHSQPVAPEKGNEPSIIKSEPELIKDASVGGLARDAESGKIKQTYTGEPPEDCAT